MLSLATVGLSAAFACNLPNPIQSRAHVCLNGQDDGPYYYKGGREKSFDQCISLAAAFLGKPEEQSYLITCAELYRRALECGDKSNLPLSGESKPGW